MKAANYTYTFNNYNLDVSLITNCLIMYSFYLVNIHSYHFSELVKSKTKLLLFFDRNTLVFILMYDNRGRKATKKKKQQRN